MTCSVDDCGDSELLARGMCSKHYHRWHRTVGSGKTCSLDDCDRPFYGNDLCQRHYGKWYQTGTLAPLHAPRECDLPGCSAVHFGRGWCVSHYTRWRRCGDPLGNGLPPKRLPPEVRARYEAATPLVRSDLRMALTMREHGRRRDVEFYLARAESHGRPLTRLEFEFAEGVRMPPDRERDTSQLLDDVMRLSAKGLSAKDIGTRLGVSARTVVRYRAQAKKLENINA